MLKSTGQNVLLSDSIIRGHSKYFLHPLPHALLSQPTPTIPKRFEEYFHTTAVHCSRYWHYYLEGNPQTALTHPPVLCKGECVDVERQVGIVLDHAVQVAVLQCDVTHTVDCIMEG